MDLNFVILVSVFCFLLVLVFFYLFLKHQDSYFRIWVIAGSIYTGEFLLDNLYNHFSDTGMTPFVSAFDWVLLLWGSLLMTWGIYRFRDKSLPKGWLYSFLAVMFFSVLNIYFFAHHYPVASFWLSILSYFFYGLGFVWAGIQLFFYPEIRGVWKYMAVVNLVLWGLDLSVFRIIKNIPNQPTWSDPREYLFAVTFSVLAVISLLMLTLQKKDEQEKEKLDLLQYSAHDLKTKVLIIQNYISSIQKKIYPNETLGESLQVVNDEAESLGSQVRSILHFNKLNHFRGRTKHERFFLNELIAHCVELFRWRRSDLRWEIKMEEVLIVGSQEQWKVIIENILDNQTRFAKECIRITLQFAEKKGEVLLSVWNDGPGIEPDLLKSIFEVYRSGKGGKSGLGMYIIKKSLQSQHAEIQVVNENNGVAYVVRVKKGNKF